MWVKTQLVKLIGKRGKANEQNEEKISRRM